MKEEVRRESEELVFGVHQVIARSLFGMCTHRVCIWVCQVCNSPLVEMLDEAEILKRPRLSARRTKSGLKTFVGFWCDVGSVLDLGDEGCCACYCKLRRDARGCGVS